MTVQCVACARFRLKEAERMAARGFGLCALRPAWEFYPAKRPKECGHFDPAPADVAQDRLEWIERKENVR